jgi:hypothetical protein
VLVPADDNEEGVNLNPSFSSPGLEKRDPEDVMLCDAPVLAEPMISPIDESDETLVIMLAMLLLRPALERPVNIERTVEPVEGRFAAAVAN